MRRFFRIFDWWVEVTGEELVGWESFAHTWCIEKGCATPSVIATMAISHDPPPRIESSPSLRVAHGDGWVFAFWPGAYRGAAWFEPGRPVDAWQYAAPLRLIVAWMMSCFGGVLVHAAGISTGYGDGGVLLAGPSGSGKSTLSVAAARKFGDLRFWGDDWVPVMPAPTTRSTLATLMGSVYRSAKLAVGSPTMDGVRAEIVGPPGVVPHPQKRVIQLRTAGVSSLPVRAVVVPEVHGGGRDVRLETMRPRDALRRIAPSTVLQAPQCERALKELIRLVENVPCYRMQVGTDLVVPMKVLEGLCLG